MKYLALGILTLMAISQAHAYDAIPHDITIHYQKVTRDTSGWAYSQLMGDMDTHDKTIVLSPQNAEVTSVLASLNPSLGYCCTTTAYQEQKSGNWMKVLPVFDLQCKPYPAYSRSLVRLPGNCNFSAQ